MTMFEPYLRLDRLYISKGGKPAYDQQFHAGVNIIRGKNGSGKSTIAEFIRFVLGANLLVWKREASLCDFVVAQICINGKAVCLKREVSQERFRPMSIYWGNFDSAISDLRNWEVYPYSRSTEKLSFSQKLFQEMDLPELRGEVGENITLHQLTRLMYVDQRTNYSEIFVEDGDFDSLDKRGAVADYLCGIFIDDLYNSKLEKKRLEDEVAKRKHELAGITKILSGSNSALSREAFNAEISNTQQELNKKEEELQEIAKNKWQTDKKAEKETRERAQKLEKKIIRLRREMRKIDDSAQLLELEIEDSSEFIKHLKSSIEALDQSHAVSQYLGVAQFENCPACFNAIANGKLGTCSLCGSEMNLEKVGIRNRRLKSEILFQLKESEALQDSRHTRVIEIEEERRQKQVELRNAESEFQSLQIDMVTDAEKTIARISRQIGYLQRQLEDLTKQSALADRMASLSDEIAQLGAKIVEIDTRVAGYQQQQESKRKAIYTTISDKTVDLLHKDLAREATFANAQRVVFDFREGKIFTVVEAIADSFKTREFSASSMVYLKNSFHLAIHLASLELDYMRYPRFSLFDNIEDKGMEVERSQNFQKQLVAMIKASKVENQLIFTTSMIAPELDIPEYTIGEFYTEENKTLKGFI